MLLQRSSNTDVAVEQGKFEEFFIYISLSNIWLPGEVQSLIFVEFLRLLKFCQALGFDKVGKSVENFFLG